MATANTQAAVRLVMIIFVCRLVLILACVLEV
jgi:hypothetical protein